MVLLLCMLGVPLSVYSQTLEVVAQTGMFTDYEIRNDSLTIAYRQELTIPYSTQRQTWRVLEQEVITRKATTDEFDRLPHIIEDVDSNSPPVQVVNPGVFRKQQVATLVVHNVRLSPNDRESVQILKAIRIRVYTEPVWDESAAQTVAARTFDIGHPLATGVWYRIPVKRDGIHQLDRTYLQNLGVNVSTVDPRNIQIWGSSGYELPLLNSEPRSGFVQIPIIVTGESDGSLDAADVVLFYGNSPHRYLFNQQTNVYAHRIHPYSDVNYVFLTIGQDPGLRITETSAGNSIRTITTFRDFIWKEQELYRSDSRTKSGTQWLGQQFTTESFANTQTILHDTIPGFVQNSRIDITVEYAARASSVSRFVTRIGTTQLGTTSISGITDLNSSTDRAANFGRLNTNIPSASLQGNILQLTGTFENAASSAFGWLDWIRVRLTRELTPKNGILHYFSPDDGSQSQVGTHILKGFGNRPLVMDVTNPLSPVMYNVVQQGSDFAVNHHTNPGSRFVAQTQFLRPEAGSRVENQNLQGITDYPDLVIITNDDLLQEARDFAEYRRLFGGWNPVVVTQDQIFNEFNGGVTDVVAIRDYLRFLYNRAGIIEQRMPRHVLFFGDTTFDYKGYLTDARYKNQVITYQSHESFDRSTSFASDDFFVLLDPNEGVWAPTPGFAATFERIDMGVGRLPIQTPQEARLLIEKIKNYEDPSTFGDWRTLFTFSSDDDINGNRRERDLHVWNAEGTAESIDRDASGIRLNKIYQINYPVINTPMGRLAPEANQAFVNSINNGTLIMNYSGHGSEQLLSAEQLFRSEDIVRLHNRDRLTIMVTATCDFGRFDDPDDQSGAEKMMLWANGGAIASFTTTRVVFTSGDINSYNFGLNVQLSQQMVIRDSEGLPSTLGDIYLRTKNTTIGATFNSRKFILLGDPSMRIGLPRNRINLSSINDIDLQGDLEDTFRLRALDQAVLSGFIAGADGSVDVTFNGEASVQVFDAERFIELPDFEGKQTSGCYTPNCRYRMQNDMIFNGLVTVSGGMFTSRFIIPNDIAYSDANGRILVYGQDPSAADAVGSFSDIIFNGRNPDAVNDNTGPEINIFLNDLDFTDGDLVNDSPRLIVLLEDQSGINTAGAGVGHELIAYLSKDPSDGNDKTIILNSFYRSELDDFTRGRVDYPLDRLQDGRYTLRVRAWDVFNNMSEKQITFEVARKEELSIRNVYNYPNPMSNYTRFVFEHNQTGHEMDVMIRVFTLSGRPVATISRENLITTSNLVQIPWDGFDDDRNPLAAGTYIYHVRVRSEHQGKRVTRDKTERIVILR